MDQPEYFKRVRRKATERWDQLESDPELAGPWRLLFDQVQSPRHVLSELLQNADDAGATKASVEVLDGEFIFSHNGEDFDEQQFASLCRFGFSNKRTLHTIGFRGVGFKSTFSLGDEVSQIVVRVGLAPLYCVGNHLNFPFLRFPNGFPAGKSTIYSIHCKVISSVGQETAANQGA